MIGKRIYLHVCLLLGLLVCSVVFSSMVSAASSNRYSITLVSSLKPIEKSEYPDVSYLKNYYVYTSHFTKDKIVWNRLRLGFFDSLDKARPILTKLRKRYSDAWINSVSDDEFKHAQNTRVSTDSSVSAKAPVKDVPKAPPTNISQSARDGAALLAEARKKLTDGDSAAALTILKRIQRSLMAEAKSGQQPQAQQVQLAMELQGVSEERLGQVSKAMSTYKQYLSLYKKGDDVERVKQRLAVLETATSPENKAMAKFKEKTRKSVEWSGSFSQFSSRDIHYLEDGGTQVRSLLFNDLGVSSRIQTESVDIRTQFDSSYRYTFNDDHTTDDDFRLSTLFADVSARNHGASARLGRQSSSSGGVLGRFDGVSLSYRARPRWKYNLVAGYPVELSSSSYIDQKDRSFTGLSIDMGTFAKVWDFSLFGINQKINGITDRQAVGGEVRFSNRNRSHLLLLDYDTSYSVVNSAVFLSNWFLPTQTSINFILDTRSIPVLATTNALFGRTELGVDELLSILSESEIRQLAQDRTSRSYSATLGVSHPFSDKYQLTGEVSAYNQTNTVASGGVEAIDNGGNQYSAGLTLIGSSMFKEGDISIIGMRYFNTDFSITRSLNMNVRYPLTKAWRLAPSLNLDYRNSINSIKQLTIRPAFRVDYRWLSNITFDAELAALHVKDLEGSAADFNDVFFELGYRVDF